MVFALLATLAATASSANEIEGLLRSDGTVSLLEEIPSTLDQTVRSQLDPGGETPSYDPVLVTGRFSATRIRARMLELLGTSWRLESGREVVAWFESPLDGFPKRWVH